MNRPQRKEHPARGQKQTTPKAQVLKGMNDSLEPQTFCCTQCGKSCSGIPYSFSCQLACESCVRAYYHGRNETEIAEELRYRASDARRLMSNDKKRRLKPLALSANDLCDICGRGHFTENCKMDF